MRLDTYKFLFQILNELTFPVSEEAKKNYLLAVEAKTEIKKIILEMEESHANNKGSSI